MILSAYQHYRGFVEAVYPALLEQDRILHLDHPLRTTTAVQGVEGGSAVQLYVPNCVASSPTFNTWQTRADVLASTVNDALILADKLTAALKESIRRPQLEREVRTESLSGVGYGVVRVSWRFVKKP